MVFPAPHQVGWVLLVLTCKATWTRPLVPIHLHRTSWSFTLQTPNGMQWWSQLWVSWFWLVPNRNEWTQVLSDQKKQWKLIHRDVWAHISQLKTRRGNLLTPDIARHCLPNLERKRNDMLTLLESPQNFPMQKVRDGWVPCKSILWLYRVLGPTWVGRVCWYVDSHSCTARFWDFGVARNLYKDMIAFCFCLMI